LPSNPWNYRSPSIAQHKERRREFASPSSTSLFFGISCPRSYF
jgi:hypothetical protein